MPLALFSREGGRKKHNRGEVTVELHEKRFVL